MNTEQQQLTDYIRILTHNHGVDEDVQEYGRTDKRHINLNTTTAELFAMMVTARALVDISDSLKALSKGVNHG